MRLIPLFLLALLTTQMGSAAPVDDNDRLPIDLRRTTLVVRDIDLSLAFYRDALGLEVIYDNKIVSPRGATPEAATKMSRLVFLRSNDTFVGVLGLLQYLKPVRPAPHQGAEPFSTGSTVLVFNAQDVENVFDKAAAVNGVRSLSRPSKVTYPSYDGKSTIPVMVSVLTDPDGFVIELNELLGTVNQ